MILLIALLEYRKGDDGQQESKLMTDRHEPLYNTQVDDKHSTLISENSWIRTSIDLYSHNIGLFGRPDLNFDRIPRFQKRWQKSKLKMIHDRVGGWSGSRAYGHRYSAIYIVTVLHM